MVIPETREVAIHLSLRDKKDSEYSLCTTRAWPSIVEVFCADITSLLQTLSVLLR